MSVNEHAGQTCAFTAGENNLFERANVFACTLQPSRGRPQIRSYVGPGGQRTVFLLTRSTILRGKCDDGLIRVSQISTRTPIVTIATQRNSSSPCHQLQGPHTKTLSYVSHFRALRRVRHMPPRRSYTTACKQAKRPQVCRGAGFKVALGAGVTCCI